MDISLLNQTFSFRPWRPCDGRVFRGLIAFDCETTLIDDEDQSQIPAMVICAAFDGQHGVFVTPQNLESFFAAHTGLPVVFHNAVFDLSVINTRAPSARVYDAVDRNEMWCTMLLHKLLRLGTAGDVAALKNESTLERCCADYMNLILVKDAVDRDGDEIRLSYHKFLGRPASEIDRVYLEYLAKDVIATYLLFYELWRRLADLLSTAEGAFGFVSHERTRTMWDRFGPQTHHIQLKAAIVLKEISRNGLHLDLANREEHRKQLLDRRETLREELRQFGFLAGGKGSGKALQSILKRLERECPGTSLPRTPTGQIGTSKEALQEVAHVNPFVTKLLEYWAVEKLLSSCLDKMSKSVIHPSFNVLARTGRTTSFGEMNAQNLPKNSDIRSLFVPSPEHVYIDADYSMIEMVTLASGCQQQFSLPSEMAAAINRKTDLHRLVAAHVGQKPVDQVTKVERQKAKPINFGRPGGMGPATLQRYAKVSYDVDLSEDEVNQLLEAWMALFPEMEHFLGDSHNAGLRLAEMTGMTASAHFTDTGNRRFIDHPENLGRENQPHPILGQMALKVLRVEQPSTARGGPYNEGDLEFFWSKMQSLATLLAAPLADSLKNRQPSNELWRIVRNIADEGWVITATGRLRAKARYTARHNTIFQGLAADGAKIALWKLWRAGFRIVNFIHDEALVEVSKAADLRNLAEQIKSLMIAGMREVVPDVRIDVSYAASERWYKDAEEVSGDDGQLLLWRPSPPREIAVTSPAIPTRSSDVPIDHSVNLSIPS